MIETSRSTRAPIWLAALLTLSWWGLLAWQIASDPEFAAGAERMLLVAALGCAVPALPWAVAAAFLAASRRGSISHAALAEESAADVEARMAGIAGRIGLLRDAVSADLANLLTAADALEARTRAAHEAVDEAARRADAATTSANALAEALPAATQAGSLLLETLAQSAPETARQQAALEQAFNVAKAVVAARQNLQESGAEAARAIQQRLDTIAARADGIDHRLKTQQASMEALTASAERALKVLDARLEHSARLSSTQLDALAGRVSATSSAIDALAEPLRGATAQAEKLDGSVAHLRETALQTVDVLEATLPQQAVRAGKAAETMRLELDALIAAVDAAADRATALAQPVQASREALVGAAQEFASQREAMETAGHALVVELNQARTLIAEVEETTAATSLAAATRLVDAMTRVREVAAQAAGTMRETLAGVIEEARDALGNAAADATRRSFIEPVDAKIRETSQAVDAAGEVARAVAERTAASLAALAGTTRALDARIAERDREVGWANQEALASAASLLNDRLASAAIDLSAALGRPMDEADWAAWRQGKRGIFGRRAMELVGRHERERLQQLVRDDATFAAAAHRYIADYDALLGRLGADPRNEPLAALMRDTPHGRLAAVLSETLS